MANPVEARFVEKPPSFDWRPWALALIGLLILGVLVTNRNRSKPTETTTQIVASNPVKKTNRIGPSPLLPPPPSSQDDSTTDESPATISLKAPQAAATTPETNEDTPSETAAPPQTDDTPPVDQPSDLVKLGNVAVDTEQDDTGNSFAVGHVMVVNTSSVEISTFSITMDTGDGVFTLVPFEGTIDAPQTITDRRIPPGGYLDVPVMTEGVFQTGNSNGQKVITLTANENGLIATDRLTIQ